MAIRLYPDTNVVHRLREKWTPAEFDQRAAARGVVLAVGFHVLYELGRGFVGGRSASEVRAACHFLAEIRNVEHLPQAREIIRAELFQAELGVPIVTVLSRINQFSTRLELTRLACGFADQAATFIARREAAVEVGNPRTAQANRANLQALRKTTTFEAFRLRLLPSGPATLSELASWFRVKVSARALERVMASSSEFPTLTTWLNGQWYMGWIAVHKGEVPAKLDDLRHLLESARCDAFVTDDRNLAKVGPVISPSRACLAGQDLFEVLK